VYPSLEWVFVILSEDEQFLACFFSIKYSLSKIGAFCAGRRHLPALSFSHRFDQQALAMPLLPLRTASSAQALRLVHCVLIPVLMRLHAAVFTFAANWFKLN
tara:strand:- start:1415 stop:1720 length:306 start_codon:yes stop_codon:yes gene_type:complete